MNSRFKKLIGISLVTFLLGLLAVRSEAGQRIDGQWLWEVGGDQCIPNDAEVTGCEAPVAKCRQEFEGLMDGIMYTFCSGANPEICTSLAYRVVEFSNMGYSHQVAPAIDRFFWTNDFVRDAFQCISNHKNQAVFASDVMKYRAVELAQTRTPLSDYTDRLGHNGEWIETTPEAKPAPTQPPVQERLPGEDSSVIPESPQESEALVPVEGSQDEVVVEEGAADSPDFTQPEVVSPNEAVEFAGAGCTLNYAAAPTPWAVSLFATLVFTLFLFQVRRKKMS